MTNFVSWQMTQLITLPTSLILLSLPYLLSRDQFIKTFYKSKLFNLYYISASLHDIEWLLNPPLNDLRGFLGKFSIFDIFDNVGQSFAFQSKPLGPFPTLLRCRLLNDLEWLKWLDRLRLFWLFTHINMNVVYAGTLG